MAPIANAMQLLRQGAGTSSMPALHDMIDRQTKRLARLVDELLDIARINRGLIQLKREPLNLATIVKQTADAMGSQLEARQQELSITLPESPVRVNGDPTRLEQIISNLLDNASKYTAVGGRIQLTLTQPRGEAVISVRDNGIGLAPEALEEIFDLFTQVTHSPENSAGGLGIGLTLVRRVLELHGGRIEARSTGLGHGSEFIVRLPLLAPPEGTLQSVDTNTQDTPISSGFAVPRRVLIVDDNEDAGQSLALLLRSWGHEALFAADGPSAITLAEELKPQTALLDIGMPGMPGMNGYQLARHFRAVPQYASLQLVALTGFGREEDRNAALAAGFDVPPG